MTCRHKVEVIGRKLPNHFVGNDSYLDFCVIWRWLQATIVVSMLRSRSSTDILLRTKK